MPKIRNDYVTLTKPKRPDSATFRYKFQLTPADITFNTNISTSNSIKSGEVHKKQNTPSKLTDSDMEKLATYDKKKTKVESCVTGHDSFNSICNADSFKTGENSRFPEDLFLAELTETSKLTDQESAKKTEKDKLNFQLAEDESEDLIKLMLDADENISKSKTTATETSTRTTTTDDISIGVSRQNRNNVTDESNTSNAAHKTTKVGTYSDWVRVGL